MSATKRPEPLAIGVVGAAGRLGRELLGDILCRADVRLAFASARPGASVLGADVSALVGGSPAAVIVTAHEPAHMPEADVVIDVSSPEASLETARACAETRTALVHGVTGLTQEAFAGLERAASAIPLLHAKNFSVGAAVLSGLVRRAAGSLQDFDIEVVEVHHNQKRDAPSGTALALSAAAAEGRGVVPHLETGDRSGVRDPGAIGVAVIRGGGVVGEHAVRFEGPHESLILEHRVRDRRVFARGAVDAAIRLHGRAPGLYAMADLFPVDA